jgi:hypothetical protein
LGKKTPYGTTECRKKKWLGGLALLELKENIRSFRKDFRIIFLR